MYISIIPIDGCDCTIVRSFVAKVMVYYARVEARIGGIFGNNFFLLNLFFHNFFSNIFIHSFPVFECSSMKISLGKTTNGILRSVNVRNMNIKEPTISIDQCLA